MRGAAKAAARMMIGRSISRLAPAAAQTSGWRPAPVRSAKRQLQRLPRMQGPPQSAAKRSARSAAASIAPTKALASASIASTKAMANGSVRAKKPRADRVAMTRASIASAPAAIARKATGLLVGIVRLAIVPAVIERLAIVRVANVARVLRVVIALVRSPSRVKPVPNAHSGIARRAAIGLSATNRTVIVRLETSPVATGVRVPRETSVPAANLSAANSAPNVLAAIARLGIVHPVATGPLVIVRRASALPVIGRPANHSAKSRAAANPLAASRVVSPAARAALAASQVAQAVRPVAPVAVVPVVVAPAEAVPRVEGVNAL